MIGNSISNTDCTGGCKVIKAFPQGVYTIFLLKLLFFFWNVAESGATG